MYIALCAEAEIYVPAFPDMIKYFAVSENQIQLVLSINFAGLCISGIVVGPLADAYGRRKILIIGLLLFTLTSLGCVYSYSFYFYGDMEIITRYCCFYSHGCWCNYGV